MSRDRIDTVVVGIELITMRQRKVIRMKSKRIAGTVCAEDEKIPRNELVAAIIENLCKLYQDLPDKSFMEDYRKWSNVSWEKDSLYKRNRLGIRNCRCD